VHGQYPVAAAVGQRLAICFPKFGWRRRRGGSAPTVVDVVGNVVNAVTQVDVVE
jgi:hypothetical protein